MDNSLLVHPVIKVLPNEAIDQVHKISLRILSEIGLRVDSQSAIKVFKKSPGVKFLGDDHLTLEPELVEWAIDACPSSIDIYDRMGHLMIHLGHDSTKFGIGVTNLFYQDPKSEEILPFSRQHMRQSVALGNHLPSFDVISTIGILRDVKPDVADMLAVLEMVANTIKPLIILVSDQAQFLPSVKLLEYLSGDLISKPFVVPYFNPVTPLILNQSTAENMLTSIERGLPLIYSNYGMAGMSTPITSAGTLALLNAELLAGLVFSQLVKQGTPVILGSLPAFFDMKTMQDFFDPQTMLLNLASAEMMSHYQIPHAGTSGSANGWGADLVASETLMINQLTSCLGKVGLAPFVGGSFGSKVFSPLMTVFANEVIEQSRQFAKGFIINDDTLALEEVRKADVGGSFVSARQTMQLFREAYHTSNIFPRLSLEKWQELGGPEATKYLRERTLDLLDHPIFPEDKEELLNKGEYLVAHPDMI
ncbi:MAG TPA: trimethylamine methyltransferase family protein [Anaerolineales bacterium]|nr:trimethylamine methyltransferase family protein [Anaerolineales bacterium]